MNGRPRFALLAGFGLLLAATALPGCAGNGPTATIERAAVAERTPEGARVEVTLRIDNPTDEALPVRAAVYRITVADADPFDMLDHPPTVLPPNGQQTLVLPAAFADDGEAAWVGREVRVRGELRYQPPGQIRKLLTDYGFPLPIIPFAASGELTE